MMKTVSVIVTTYNSEKTIRKTLESILSQTGNNVDFKIELIVVDDCSTDNTRTILNANGIHFLSTAVNSGGPNKGRNIALQASSGDYICIADHDDLWHANKIQSLWPFLEDAPIVTSGYTLVDTSTNKTINRSRPRAEKFLFFEKNSTFLAKLQKSQKGQNTYLGSIIFESRLKSILFEEHFGVVDFDWVLRLFYNNTSIEVCDSLYTRFVDGRNLSLNENYRRKDFYYSLYFIENYLIQYPKEVKLAYKKIHGSRARYYYLVDNMPLARFYFLKSKIDFKTITYYLSTFWGAKYIKKKFNVFG